MTQSPLFDKACPAIVVLTGAGISQESGLDTFRCAGGLWSQVRLEDVATPEGFARNPEKVQGFYNARRHRLLSGEIAPNAAHFALAKLEQQWPAPVVVVTQNIDDLHARAGSRNLLAMHGELCKVRCLACQHVQVWSGDVDSASSCAGCGAAGTLRPHVVWFGEMPFHLDAITAALETCTMFVAIGTSGSVYPAAGFVDLVSQRQGVRTIELNLEPSEASYRFDHSLLGPASEVVPAFVEQLLSGNFTDY